jgi:HTH-type transcriptional regulator/antitoxin HigA
MPMLIHPIRSDRDLQDAGRRIEALWDATPGSAEEEELELLTELVCAYEEKHLPLLPPHPLEAIKAMLEMKGMTIADLAPIMPKNRAYEVLSGKRALNLRMIRGLHDLLGIPYDCLMQDHPPKVS